MKYFESLSFTEQATSQAFKARCLVGFINRCVEDEKWIPYGMDELIFTLRFKIACDKAALNCDTLRFANDINYDLQNHDFVLKITRTSNELR
ncbi:hypothetical protein Smp_173130 [Schistosoma mansoni]|uniref:hypothetical protein n=1 Tax=Schistosoma mansoni TaxID=6183 RepID=UPI00022DCC42|nr:hypothetical protein Smp_173130 [Schistosoma mansoni]|eukprot:XP_018655555.1 hypothetical protein Smp_173130 [Schistosoma mansoni]